MGNELRAVSRVWFNVGSHGSGDEWETVNKDIPAPGTSCKERRSRALRFGPPQGGTGDLRQRWGSGCPFPEENTHLQIDNEQIGGCQLLP